MRQLRNMESLLAKPCGIGEPVLDLHAGQMLAVLSEKPDAVLDEMIAILADRHNIQTSQGALCRFFSKRHRITRKKKSMLPSEQECPDMIKERRRWGRRQHLLDSTSLVYSLTRPA